VQRWFAENGVEYVRAYPSALLAGESDDLFAPAGDDWPVEQWLAQLGWMKALGHEGGLFVTVGRAGVPPAGPQASRLRARPCSPVGLPLA
jgi:hypothetical protein